MTDEVQELRTQVEALRRKMNARLDGVGYEEEHESVADILAEIDRLETRLDEFDERLRRVERVVDTDPDRTEYAEMTKEQKVFRIRQELVQNADATDGTWQLTYRDVKALFNGQPSAGHCYNLMEAAAQLDGFEYDRPGEGDATSHTGQYRIRVTTPQVNDTSLFQSVNNGISTEGVQ